MKKFLPIVVVIFILGGLSYYIFNSGNKSSKPNIKKESFILKDFNKPKNCAVLPGFLYKKGILQPIIDLSQQHYTGIAFYYGKNFDKVLHKKQWEQFEHLGTYTISSNANIYLTPNPFISIKPTTFNLQKAIYKLDGVTGKLSRWMVIDEVKPTSQNPYGLISILFDCKDNTLWVSSIDKSNYKEAKGRIYHIDIKNKKILSKTQGFDALTLNWIYTKDNRYIIAGSARDNGVYLFKLKGNSLEPKPIKLFELPDPTLRVRKIKVVGKNHLKVEAIKFNYSLVAQTAKKQRVIFDAIYDSKAKKWTIKKL